MKKLELFLTFGFFLMLIPSVKAWGNSSYSYYVNVTITETAGKDLGYYPYVFWTGHSGHADYDNGCIDVLIYSNEGQVILFGIRGCNSTHVEVVTKWNVSASSTSTQTIYYGNNTFVDFQNSSWNDVRYNYYYDFDATDYALWDKWDDDDGTVIFTNPQLADPYGDIGQIFTSVADDYQDAFFSINLSAGSETINFTVESNMTGDIGSDARSTVAIVNRSYHPSEDNFIGNTAKCWSDEDPASFGSKIGEGGTDLIACNHSQITVAKTWFDRPTNNTDSILIPIGKDRTFCVLLHLKDKHDAKGFTMAWDNFKLWNQISPSPTYSQGDEQSVTQISTNTTLIFNGTANSTTITWGDILNLTAEINTTGLYVKLYMNGTLINNGTDFVTNITDINWFNGNTIYEIKAEYPGNVTFTASSDTHYITVNGLDSELALTSSLGWSITASRTTTLGCTVVDPLTVTLKIDDVTVSNPYNLQVDAGIYAILCEISDSQNYTPPSSSATITVNPLISCTSEDVYAFNKTVTTTTDYTTLNFTDLVNQHYVRKSLGDVNVTNVNNTWINFTAGYYVIVNNTGLSSFVVKFGNYFINNTYTTSNYSEVQNMTIYNQRYPAILYNVLDELTGEELYPPNTTLTSIIHCSKGENYISIGDNVTNILLASEEYIDKASLRISYTADMYYSRQLYPSESDLMILNFYVIDAYINALDRIDFKMLDTDYYESKFQVYKPIDNDSITITEGYFDASHYFSAYLMEDSDYYLRTVNTDGSITSFGRITVVRPDEKELGKTYYSLNPQAVLIADNILMNAYTDEDRVTLYIEYEDLLNQTEEVIVTIYFENSTVFDNTTYTTNIVDTNHNITPYANDSFTVTFTVLHTTLGNSPVVYTMSLLTPIVWGISGVSSMMYSLFSLTLLLLVGGITTRRSLIPGSILLVVTFLIVWGVGWLSGVDQVAQLFVFVVVILMLSIINYLKQGGE